MTKLSPVPDYASGLRSSYTRDQNNESRLQQAIQTNANRRVENAREFSTTLQRLGDFAPTIAREYKAAQREKDTKRQQAQQAQIREQSITSEEYYNRDELDSKLSATTRELINRIHKNPRDVLAAEKFLAYQSLQNFPAYWEINKNPIGYSRDLSPVARKKIITKAIDDYKNLNGLTYDNLGGELLKELKINETFDSFIRQENKQSSIIFNKKQDAEEKIIFQENLSSSINSKSEIAGVGYLENINRDTIRHGGDRSFTKQKHFNWFLDGVANGKYTEAEIEFFLNSTTGEKQWPTIRDYLTPDQAKAIKSTYAELEDKQWKEAKDRNKINNEQIESKIMEDIKNTPGITSDEQYGILDVAISKLIEKEYNPTNLERLRDNLNEGTPQIQAKDRSLQKAFETNTLTEEMVNQTSNAYLMNKWLSKAEKQEASRETEEYKSAYKSLEQSFGGDTNFMLPNGKLTPAATGIVSQLKRDFDKQYAKLDPSDPNSATQAAALILQDFKSKDGGGIDKPGLYSWDSASGTFKNYLESIGADYTPQDILIYNTRNKISELQESGLSKNDIVNTDNSLLDEQAMEKAEDLYENSNEWSPYLKALSNELKLPPWIIYNLQGGKKIKETDEAKKWRELTSGLKVSLMRDPSQETYNQIAYSLSNINDEEVNMALWGQPVIPTRPAFA